MKLEFKIVFGFTLSLAVLHWWLLDLYPLPWFDEVHFAGISKSLATDGSLKSYFLTATKGEMNSVSYGPVFFTLNAFLINLFGFSIYTLRSVTLFFGLMNLLLLYLLSVKFLVQRIIRLGIVFCFGLDAVYSTTLHEARMETLVTFFVLLSLTVFYLSDWKEVKKVVVIALLLVLCFLTSPRSFFLIGSVAVLFLFEIKESRLKMALLFSVLFVGVYSVWVFTIYGDYQNWFAYYQTLMQGNSTAPSGYLGGNFYVSKAQYLLLLTVCLASFVVFIAPKKLPKITWCLYAIIVLFYTLIFDWGVYSSLIIPFFYFLLMLLLNQLGQIQPKTVILIIPLLLFNFLFFGLKTSTVILEKNNRSTELVTQQLQKLIPKGSRVIGDDLMIYIAEKNHWTYQVFTHYKTAEQREQSLRKQFDYEYLLVSQLFCGKHPEELQLYQSKATLDLISEQVNKVHPINQFLEKIGLSTMEKNAYSYYLYKRR